MKQGKKSRMPSFISPVAGISPKKKAAMGSGEVKVTKAPGGRRGLKRGTVRTK